MVERLLFTCPGFFDGGEFPIDNTGKGENKSPAFYLENLSPQAKTLAITLEDLTHPLKKDFTHWLIWNIPISTRIPPAIARGFEPANLVPARQGIAYGWYAYAGPKPPLGQTHRYRFIVYVLDSPLNLGRWTLKAQLLKAMQGHILQKGELTASFGSPKNLRPLPAG
ncbi:YbhB/YbcL family Raf kinase inhibitor-like protein [Streptococcus dentapri]|uniref:YbhB/YbcL family Raf kinase inhibitor-like protein n=1 Tax=Streptococcus dentapri TaxID=573564 RepID=A0ABV8D365_9STRE